jgi:hypothetical protein
MKILNFELAIIGFTGLEEPLKIGDSIVLQDLDISIVEYMGPDSDGMHYFKKKRLFTDINGNAISGHKCEYELLEINDDNVIDKTISLKTRLATKEEIKFLDDYSLEEDKRFEKKFNIPITEKNYFSNDNFSIIAIDVNDNFKIIIVLQAEITISLSGKTTVNHRTYRYDIKYGHVYPYDFDDNLISEFNELDIISLFEKNK